MLRLILYINSVRVATKRRRSRFHSGLFVNILSTGTVPGKGFMATPINAPMAGEIWHLSIEDLFQPVQEAPRLGGDGPFVINLSVSTAPINLPTKAFTHSRLEAHVYQIQVTEDGRTRYRLRLGPFATEDEADAVLAEVRDTYPGALTATASASDLRVIGTMQSKVDSRQAAQKPAANVVIDKAVSAKIAATSSAPEKAAPEKAAAERAAPEKTAPAKAAVEKVASKAEAEISIDIAWPTPALVVPPSAPVHAAAAPVHHFAQAAPASAPVHAAPRQHAATSAAPEPQWELPELDVPLPSIQKRPAVSATPVLTETVTAAPKTAAKAAEPLTLVVDAPTLTEVVVPSKSHSSKGGAKRAAAAAPMLTGAVPSKSKAPPAPLSAPGAKKATATPVAAAPVAVPAPVAVHATPAPLAVHTTPAPVAEHATPAPTPSPAAASPPASATAPLTKTQPALSSLPVRTALTASCQ